MPSEIKMQNFETGPIGDAVNQLHKALASEGYAFGVLYVARKTDGQGIIILATEMPNRMKAGVLGDLIADSELVRQYYKRLS